MSGAQVENMELATQQCQKSDQESVLETSVPNEMKSSCMAYDSGNYSVTSNNSEISCPFEIELNNHCQHIHTLLKERDQALFIAMQDVRKLRSELERLNKSEEWYKKELRAQKNTRLEALERLYAQERKYMQENQRLQHECVRLYEKCGDLEKDLQEKRDKVIQKLVEDEQITDMGDTTDKELNKFELEQQRSLVNDQEKLIDVLRKQKHVLLEDLRRLNTEKDTKVLELQQTLAGIEVENTQMTAQCKRLLTERQILECTLKTKDEALNAEIAEKLKMTALIEELKEQSKAQHELLAHKELEIQELRQTFNDNMQNERNMDEVHRLSISYHEEINSKTAEISSLKKSLYAIQIELNTLTDLQSQNEEQERHIEQLNFSLETQKCELKNLKQTDEEKTHQISDLQQNLEKIRNQHDITLEQMSADQCSLKNVKRELIALHEQYASMCALCEKTRFELEILEIENGKLRFQSEGDKREIESLREKLKGYLKHTEDLGMRINELESKLQSVMVRNAELQEELKQNDNSNRAQDHFNVGNEQNKGFHQSKALTDRLNKLNDSHQAFELSQTDLGRVNDNEEDDSGFLETTDGSLNEGEDSTTDLQCKRDSDYATITAANEAFLQKLSSQSEVLKERQILIASLEELICNGTTNPDNDPSIIHSVEGKRRHDGLSEQQKQLMSYLSTQSSLIEEKQKLLEAFETLINEKPSPNETSHCNQNFSNIKKIIDEVEKLKTVNMEEAEILTNTNIKDSIESDKGCGKDEDYLQRKLLSDDERHLKDRTEQEHLQSIQIKNCEETIQRLQTENERLIKDMQNLMEAKFQIESALENQTQVIVELQDKLSTLEATAHADESANTHELLPPEREELLRLRANVEALETRLGAATHHDEIRRSERVRLIQQLIEQQNCRVKQLTESQEDWEELLATLEVAQKLEESARTELQLKHAELEELNALFAEQNEELRQLQEMALLVKDHGKADENERLQLAFQKEFETMRANLADQLADSEAKQRKIEELQGKNERLERRLNEDYAEEMAKNQRELRALQVKMESLRSERNHYAERLAKMEDELQQLKKSKRDGLVLPPEFVVLPENTVPTSSTEETSSSVDVNGNSSASESDSNERMRILTKVLEAEYRRKMKRYDVHIHTLLGNIKKLKKALRATEQRAAHLTLEQCKTMEELRELRLNRRQLEEMRLKCEHHQVTIKTLEQALEMERKKFEASDLGKASNITRDSDGEARRTDDEPAHEVANLIDDYKKLIQQSALATRRPKTSAILELIQRSNQCVPNLHKLETTVDGLRSDLDHFISAHAMSRRQNASASKLEGPSLMDELRAATESY